jgi:hypothetical protein
MTEARSFQLYLPGGDPQLLDQLKACLDAFDGVRRVVAFEGRDDSDEFVRSRPFSAARLVFRATREGLVDVVNTRLIRVMATHARQPSPWHLRETPRPSFRLTELREEGEVEIFGALTNATVSWPSGYA